MSALIGRLVPLWGCYQLLFCALLFLTGSPASALCPALAILPCLILFRMRQDARQGLFYLTFTLHDGRRKTVCAYYTIHLLMLLGTLCSLFLFSAVMPSIGDGEMPASRLWMLLMCLTTHLLVSSLLLPFFVGFFDRGRRCVPPTVAAALLYGGGLWVLLRFAESAAALVSSNLRVALMLGFGLSAAVGCAAYLASYLFSLSIINNLSIIRLRF